MKREILRTGNLNHRVGSAILLCLSLGFMFTSCGTEVDLYYTASLDGNLLGCDCRGYPEAGLDKRAWYLEASPPGRNALLIDAGNILETGREPFLAGLILETYAELGYDAVAVGTNELAEGIDVLEGRSAAGAVPPFLAHNLRIDGQQLSEGPLICDIGDDGDVKVAIVALADPEWFNPYLPTFNGRLELEDAVAELTRQRALADEAGASGLILLAHGSEKWVRELALIVKNTSPRAGGTPLTAIVLAGEEKLLVEKLPGGIPLVSPGEEGNRLGILNLRLRHRRPGWKNEFIEFHYLGPGDRKVAARGSEYMEHLDAKRSP